MYVVGIPLSQMARESWEKYLIKQLLLPAEADSFPPMAQHGILTAVKTWLHNPLPSSKVSIIHLLTVGAIKLRFPLVQKNVINCIK